MLLVVSVDVMLVIIVGADVGRCCWCWWLVLAFW